MTRYNMAGRSWRKTSGLAVFTLWGLAIVILCGGAGPQYVLKRRSDLILVPINVIIKRSGLPLRGLKASDFRLSVDGAAVPIAFFQEGSSPDLPLALAIVFDERGIQGSQRDDVASTFRDPSWNDWLGAISSQDLIAVLRAGNQAKVLQDYTSDRSLAARALMSLGSSVKLTQPLEKRPQGGAEFDTQLDDAIRKAAVAAPPLEGRAVKQIVVITGDLDMVEKAESEQTVEFMQRQGIMLNVVLVENIRSRMARALLPRAAALQTRGAKEPFVALTAELYAKETGGVVVKASPKRVPQAVYGLLKTLDNGYVAAFAPSSAIKPGLRHRISVMLANPENHIEMTYRQGFYLPGLTP